MKVNFSQSLHASATSMQPVYQKAQKSEYAERWLLGRRYYRELFRPANEQYTKGMEGGPGALRAFQEEIGRR